ncbi:hypothetical protein BDZ45DRAFT_363903 [Acephala macrosclerotiorum]|nr:hypothetical protein BDZ45DRAFT_363903 [Acephala macrosclerotiorum]
MTHYRILGLQKMENVSALSRLSAMAEGFGLRRTVKLLFGNFGRRIRAVSFGSMRFNIDQSDGGERGHQVKLMRNIYSKATKAHIWLGESSSEINELTRRPVSNLFMEYLHRMCSEMRKLKISGNHPASSPLYQSLLSWVEEFFWGKCKGSQRKAPEVRGLEDLCNRRWWKCI